MSLNEGVVGDWYSVRTQCSRGTEKGRSQNIVFISGRYKFHWGYKWKKNCWIVFYFPLGDFIHVYSEILSGILMISIVSSITIQRRQEVMLVQYNSVSFIGSNKWESDPESFLLGIFKRNNFFIKTVLVIINTVSCKIKHTEISYRI